MRKLIGFVVFMVALVQTLSGFITYSRSGNQELQQEHVEPFVSDLFFALFFVIYFPSVLNSNCKKLFRYTDKKMGSIVSQLNQRNVVRLSNPTATKSPSVSLASSRQTQSVMCCPRLKITWDVMASVAKCLVQIFQATKIFIKPINRLTTLKAVRIPISIVFNLVQVLPNLIAEFVGLIERQLPNGRLRAALYYMLRSFRGTIMRSKVVAKTCLILWTAHDVMAELGLRNNVAEIMTLIIEGVFYYLAEANYYFNSTRHILGSLNDRLDQSLLNSGQARTLTWEQRALCSDGLRDFIFMLGALTKSQAIFSLKKPIDRLIKDSTATSLSLTLLLFAIASAANHMTYQSSTRKISKSSRSLSGQTYGSFSSSLINAESAPQNAQLFQQLPGCQIIPNT